MNTAVLLVAYGAGNAHARMALAAFSGRCAARVGALPIRWAYTSDKVRERLVAERRKSDSVLKALLRLHYEKFEAVAIQPLHAIAGREYNDVICAVKNLAGLSDIKCSVGRPLLQTNHELVAHALIAHLPPARRADECVIFMGHGARHPAEAMYAGLGDAVERIDTHCHVGTMGAVLSLETILPRLCSRRVWLVPLLANVGGHVLRDMAGPAPSSWKSRLEAAGHECIPILAGMAESASLADIWLAHLDEALEALR